MNISLNNKSYPVEYLLIRKGSVAYLHTYPQGVELEVPEVPSEICIVFEQNSKGFWRIFDKPKNGVVLTIKKENFKIKEVYVINRFFEIVGVTCAPS
jgi:hypothetical protein